MLFLFKFALLVRHPKKRKSFWSVLLATFGFGILTLSSSTRLVYQVVTLVGLPASRPNIALETINTLSLIAFTSLFASVICFFWKRRQIQPSTTDIVVIDKKVWPPAPKDPNIL